MSRAAGRCVRARSRPSESSARMNTTCSGPRAGFERRSRRPLSALAPNFHYRARQYGELLRRDRESGREVNDRAERADKHALLHETSAQPLEIVDAVELHHADRALHAYVLHTRQVAARRKAALECGRQGGDLRKTRLP